MEQNTFKEVKERHERWEDELGRIHFKTITETITYPQRNPQPRLIMRKIKLPQFQPQPSPQVQVPKIPIDIPVLMQVGRKLMDDLGIGPKELLSDILGSKSLENKPETLIDEKGVDTEWKKKKPLKIKLKKLNQQKTKRNQKTKTTKKSE